MTSRIWETRAHDEAQAAALRLTAPDLIKVGVIDEIVKEPKGGAHTNHELAATLLDASLSKALADVGQMGSQQRLDARYQKWRAMGDVGIAEG